MIRAAISGGDLFMGSHRVDGDDGSFEIKQAQQLRDCFDLVALVRHGHLAEHEARGPSAAKALTTCRARSPGPCVKFLGVEATERSVKGVVAGNASGQSQKCAQPAFFHAPPSFHVCETLRSGQSRAKGQKQNVTEQVAARALDSWIGVPPAKSRAAGEKAGRSILSACQTRQCKLNLDAFALGSHSCPLTRQVVFKPYAQDKNWRDSFKSLR
jgi:hypothetical protein